MHENCSKCKKGIKGKDKHGYPIYASGVPASVREDENTSDKYCASCMKEERKELCKTFVITQIDRSKDDYDLKSICPGCTKTGRQMDGNYSPEIGPNENFEDIIHHYSHHLNGGNPKDDNPDFQITAREREREREREQKGI